VEQFRKHSAVSTSLLELSISGFLEHRIPSYSKGYQLPPAQVQELAGHT
jgi:hypothetical protein